MAKSERTYPIDFYLEKTEHKEPIKKMMRQLYKGISRTMDEWKSIDDQINNRRC